VALRSKIRRRRLKRFIPRQKTARAVETNFLEPAARPPRPDGRSLARYFHARRRLETAAYGRPQSPAVIQPRQRSERNPQPRPRATQTRRTPQEETPRLAQLSPRPETRGPERARKH